MRTYYITYGIAGLDTIEIENATSIEDAKEKANKIMTEKYETNGETIIGFETLRVEDENNNIVWGM